MVVYVIVCIFIIQFIAMDMIYLKMLWSLGEIFMHLKMERLTDGLKLLEK